MYKVVVTFSKTKQSSLVFFGDFWIDEIICFKYDYDTSIENVDDWTHPNQFRILHIHTINLSYLSKLLILLKIL